MTLDKILKEQCIRMLPTDFDKQEDLFQDMIGVNNFLYCDRHSRLNKDCVDAYKKIKDFMMENYNLTPKQYHTSKRMVRSVLKNTVN